MNPLFAAAVGVQAFMVSQAWRSAVIGGLAVQRWGEPRQTRDVDLALLTGLGNEAAFIDPLLAHYRARRTDAREFALSYRVVLIETATGIPLDISLAALPFEHGSSIARPRSASRPVASSRLARPKIWWCSRLSPIDRRIGWTLQASSSGKARH